MAYEVVEEIIADLEDEEEPEPVVDLTELELF